VLYFIIWAVGKVLLVFQIENPKGLIVCLYQISISGVRIGLAFIGHKGIERYHICLVLEKNMLVLDLIVLCLMKIIPVGIGVSG